MNWQKGVPKESGLYWLLVKGPVDFLQPMLFYTATDTHEAIYTYNLWWYDTDQHGNFLVNNNVYDDPDIYKVCTEDKENTYWMCIQQPDTSVSR